MKPHKAGDVIEDIGYYKVIVSAKVDTIEIGDAICYKYKVYTECPIGNDHHLYYQIFIGDELVRSVQCHKFMTKTEFKKLLWQVTIDHLKNSLNIK